MKLMVRRVLMVVVGAIALAAVKVRLVAIMVRRVLMVVVEVIVWEVVKAQQQIGVPDFN